MKPPRVKKTLNILLSLPLQLFTLNPYKGSHMKIYTKGGDAGETGLFGSVRVPKDDLRIRTYGTFDELNSALGLALCESAMPTTLQASLKRIQGELFQLG